jgi:hypothetical protein
MVLVVRFDVALGDPFESFLLGLFVAGVIGFVNVKMLSYAGA